MSGTCLHPIRPKIVYMCEDLPPRVPQEVDGFPVQGDEVECLFQQVSDFKFSIFSCRRCQSCKAVVMTHAALGRPCVQTSVPTLVWSHFSHRAQRISPAIFSFALNLGGVLVTLVEDTQCPIGPNQPSHVGQLGADPVARFPP